MQLGDPRTPPRRGAALVIAIAVLAALLFLALPFLYSQSASVAGARAGGWDGTARRAQGTAENVAAAAAIYATGISRSPSLQLASAMQNYTALPKQIANVLGIYAVADTAFRTILETDKPWTDPANTATALRPALDDPARILHGAVIEDEGRRVDPNGLGERAWAVILKRAGIPDPYTIAWSWTPGPGGGPLATYGSWHMVGYGRLARALARSRPSNSGARFAGLGDLLGANPESDGKIPFGPQSHDPNNNGNEVWPISRDTIEDSRDNRNNNSVDSEADDLIVKVADKTQKGHRIARLTQVELERLRPHLTFHALGQGRGGMVDMGNIIAINTVVNSALYGTLTDRPDPVALKTGPAYWQNGAWLRDKDGQAGFDGYLSGSAVPGDGLALDVAPALNINAVPASSALTLLYSPSNTTVGPDFGKTTAGTLFDAEAPPRTSWPLDPAITPLTALDQIPLLRWLDPRTGDGTAFERPALGVGGWGVVTVEGSATAIDPSGRAQAQRRRRVVMQTVPQERPVEASWATQAELEALIRQRHGSWIVAGPRPTNRIANWGVDVFDMLELAKAGWIEPAPVCSFGENPVVNFDWKAPFGLTGAVDWASVLNGQSFSPNANAVVAVGPDPKSSLTAQGLKLAVGDKLAYKLEATSGPIRFEANNTFQEMNPRHISLRFCFQQAPGDAVILEARAQDPGADTDTPADGVANTRTEYQSLWRVEYRSVPRELVLVIANAALPWTAADRTRFGITNLWKNDPDSLSDAAEDARCLPGTLPFAPPDEDPGARVEFHYKVKNGLDIKRWYHLQVYCASDRPGLHGLILDGIVGRDAIDLANPLANLTETGDHYTFPSMRLAAAMNAAVPTPASNAPVALGDAGSITVALPPGRTIEQCLPERGLVRIDDEYVSYTSRSGTTLSGVQRARRVNTDLTQIIANPLQCWPVTQPHAQGALVTPGWSQTPLTGGPWLRGQARLAAPFMRQPAKGTVDTSTWLPGAAPLTKAFPVAPLFITVTTADPWPASGIVRLTPGGIAAFTAIGNMLTLEWTGVPATGPPADVPNGTVISCLLLSMSVTNDAAQGDTGILDPAWNPADGEGNPKNHLFTNTGALQLLSPTDGSCEWIRFDRRVVRDAADPLCLLVRGNYFLRADGWEIVLPVTQRPREQVRGAMRTPWNSAQLGWPVGTLVLPVQTLLGNANRFEDGDVATIVPQTAGQAPVQVVVRHAARDGYPDLDLIGDGWAWDTFNHWFALAHRVPASLPDPAPGGTAQTALIGRGWSGDDLSMAGNNPTRRGALPMLRLLNGASPARMFVGCQESGAAASVIIDDLCAGSLVGPSDVNDRTASSQLEIIEINHSPTGVITNALVPAQLPVDIRTSSQLFIRQYGLASIDGEVFAWRRIDNLSATLIARALLGSVRMDHRLAPTVGPTVSGGGPVQPTLPIVILPMGPVAELCSPLSDSLPPVSGIPAMGADILEIAAENFYQDPEMLDYNGQNLYYDSQNQKVLTSPVQLITEPLGGNVEVLKLYKRPGSPQRMSAPWLRGLYGTSKVAWSGVSPGLVPASGQPPPRPGTWTATPAAPTVTWPLTGSGTLNPIVIGWWPRFAPGLPGGAGLSADHRSAQLRSRVFAWAGFPLRLHGSRFDPTIKPLDDTLDASETAAGITRKGIADVPIADEGGSRIEARALATDKPTSPVSDVIFDWQKADANATSLTIPVTPGVSNPSLRRPFDWNRFWNREVDGAELRIHWYWDKPTGWTKRLNSANLDAIDILAAAQGSTPRLGATDAQAKLPPNDPAPGAAGTAAIRLRCVAPTRILSIEEVR